MNIYIKAGYWTLAISALIIMIIGSLTSLVYFFGPFVVPVMIFLLILGMLYSPILEEIKKREERKSLDSESNS